MDSGTWCEMDGVPVVGSRGPGEWAVDSFIVAGTEGPGAYAADGATVALRSVAAKGNPGGSLRAESGRIGVVDGCNREGIGPDTDLSRFCGSRG